MKKKDITLKEILEKTNGFYVLAEIEKRLTKIYPVLVELGETQDELTINVPTGIWKFTKD